MHLIEMRALKNILHPTHLRRTCTVALIVGTWLTLFNQGGAIWSGELGPGLWAKLALNYLTPFVVANLGLVSKRSDYGEESDAHTTDV